MASHSCITHFGIGGILGCGGGGTVYGATHTATQLQYAIKRIPLHQLDQYHRSHSFEVQATHEAALMTAQTYPFIVRTLSSFRHLDNMCIVMDRLEGHTATFIAKLDASGRINFVLDVMAELAFAAEHLHAQRTSHGDIRPANILCARSGHIGMTDFGLSLVMASTAAAESTDGHPDIDPLGKMTGCWVKTKPFTTFAPYLAAS
jgi:serine/threonine protein kinase